MGLFDDLKIHSIHLPDEIKEYESGWQTKSLNPYQNLINIDEHGNLTRYIHGFKNNLTTIEKLNHFTGEIYFYQDIDNIEWEFVAFYEKGNLLKVIKVDEKDRNF